MTIEDAAKRFDLPDLPNAIAEYLQTSQKVSFTIGRRCVASHEVPPESIKLDIWTSIRIQTKTYHAPHENLPPWTINVSPPVKGWPIGRYDAIMINVDPSLVWPYSGFNGMSDDVLLSQ